MNQSTTIPFAAMVATPAGARLSAAELIRTIGMFAASADGTPQVSNLDVKELESFVATVADVSVALFVFPIPIAEEQLASAIENEFFWTDAADAFRASPAHVMLTVRTPPRDAKHCLELARVLDIVTAAVVVSTAGKGVLWASADYVIAPKMFVEQAAGSRQLAERGITEPSPLWFSFRFFPGAADRQSVVCQSTGLTLFLGREIECGPYRMRPAEIAELVTIIARHMATQGPVFGDGHTFSLGANTDAKDARLVYATSRYGAERPVFRLELAAQEVGRVSAA